MAAKAGIPMLAPPPGSGYTLRSTILHNKETAKYKRPMKRENK
jgi:hypothetical protein